MSTNNDTLAIIFDLGGVLIDWDPRYLFRQLFDGDEAEMEHFLTNICSPEWNARQDAGRSCQEAIAQLSEKHPSYEPLIQAYYERWEEMVPGPIGETVEILAELNEQGYPLFALSNWSSETFPLVRERFEFLNWFDVILLSGDVELIKPDREIYDLLLQRIEWVSEECLFIDDTYANIEAAQALGFQAIQFESPGLLRTELQERNLLANT